MQTFSKITIGLIFIQLLFIPILSAQNINPEKVVIARDTFGVPHIFAPTDAETAYGLAWAHAEDNFKDIQHALLAAKGMLGRVQGKDGVLFDFALQFLSIDSLVDARYELDLSPEFRKVLDGFIQGVNDYAEAHPKEVVHKKALPFEAKDVIKGYVLNTSLMAGLGLSLKAVREDKVGMYFHPNDYEGSNAMAVAPEMMEDGKGYLLVNSHQPTEGRFAWYEAHVSSGEGWEMMGGLFPGGASIFVGTNPDLGWAHTNNYYNFGDIYELEINPENKNQYRYDGQWKDFYIKKVKLKVKIAGIVIGVKRKVRVTAYGPVYKTKKGKSYAFRFPGYMDIRSGEQWFKMNKARDFETFEAALKMQALPLFNVVYADKAGNIMMHSGGMVPKRDPKLNWSLPITANTSDYRWTEIVPYKDIPTVINPECGYVYNANNTPLQCTGDTCDWQGYFPGLQLFMYNRGEQFDRLLKAEAKKGKLTFRALQNIKFNTSYAPDGTYKKGLGILFQLDEKKYPHIADAIRKFRNWNLGGEVDNKDAALAMVTHDFLRLKLNGPFAMFMIRDEPVSEEDAVWAIEEAKKLLLKKHKSLDVPLGQVQRHIKGEVSLPLGGLREVPRATGAKLYDKKKGIFRHTSGDCYIQVVRYSDEGAEVMSVNSYGASEHEDSPHYTDQMEMFVNRQFKPMTFDKSSIFNAAEAIYHPGGEKVKLEEALRLIEP